MPSRRIHSIIEAVSLANEILVVLAIAFDLVLTFGNTMQRYLFADSILWSQDGSTIALNVIAFMGGAAAFRRGGSLSFSWLLDRLSLQKREALACNGLWLVMAVSAATLLAFPGFFRNALVQRLAVLGVTEGWVTIWMGLGFLLLLIYSFEKLSGYAGRSIVAGFGLALLAVALVLAWRALLAGSVDLLLPILLVIAWAFVSGVPIAFVLAVGGLAYMAINGTVPLLQIPSSYQLGIASFVLLAIPFFMIAGVLMTVTGMARRLVDVLAAWFGQWRGGLLITQVAVMYVFSGLSGSKIADVAAVGSVMKEPLLERGYDPGESVAVLAAAGAMGETVPPAIAMLVLGSITTLSVGALFLAGLLPAIVLGLAIIAGILLRARRQPARKERFEFRRALACLLQAIPALLLPLIIVAGIVAGVGTPTEVSSFAVVYGLVVALLVYRSLGWLTLWRLLRDASVMAGMILLIIATATLLSSAITFDGLPATLTAFMTNHGGRVGFLVLSTAGLVIMGGLLEGVAALIIFAPILIPIGLSLGVNPLQFGIVLIMAMGIGSFAPPIGVGLYVASAVGGVSVEKAMRASVFYTVTLLVGLAVVVAFPAITLSIPALLGFR